MNVESRATASPLILPFLTSSRMVWSTTRESLSGPTLLLNLDKTAIPYGGWLASISQIFLSLGSFHIWRTSILSLGICLSLLTMCALNIPSGFLGGLPGDPDGWKGSCRIVLAKDKSILQNRVSRASYLFIAHPNKRCETHLITSLGTRMRAKTMYERASTHTYPRVHIPTWDFWSVTQSVGQRAPVRCRIGLKCFLFFFKMNYLIFCFFN